MSAFQATRKPVDLRYRGPATPAGMPTVLLLVSPDGPAPLIALNCGPGAVPVPEHLWRRLVSDEAAVDETRARIIARSLRWQREQDTPGQADTPDTNCCQMCGRAGTYPACTAPVPGTSTPCEDLLPAALPAV